MGLQLESVTTSSPFSLTQIVDDTASLRRGGFRLSIGPADGVEVEAWLNAVQRQARPLIQSEARRADLEAWLAAADSVMTGMSVDGQPAV